MEIDDLTGAVVDASIRIHQELGPGLLETVYEQLLAKELDRRGFRVDRQMPISFSLDGLQFENAFRIDLLVERLVLVEIKSIDRLDHVHTKQLITYLRLANLNVGLLLNFGAGRMKDGIRRVVNDLPRSVASRLKVNR